MCFWVPPGPKPSSFPLFQAAQSPRRRVQNPAVTSEVLVLVLSHPSHVSSNVPITTEGRIKAVDSITKTSQPWRHLCCVGGGISHFFQPCLCLHASGLGLLTKPETASFAPKFTCAGAALQPTEQTRAEKKARKPYFQRDLNPPLPTFLRPPFVSGGLRRRCPAPDARGSKANMLTR